MTMNIIEVYYLADKACVKLAFKTTHFNHSLCLFVEYINLLDFLILKFADTERIKVYGITKNQDHYMQQIEVIVEKSEDYYNVDDVDLDLSSGSNNDFNNNEYIEMANILYMIISYQITLLGLDIEYTFENCNDKEDYIKFVLI